MGQWGKAKCLWGNPPKLSTTFLVFFSNHLILPKCSWVSYCMEGEEYGQRNSNWAETHFWKSCFDFLGKKNAQKRMPFCYAFTFFSFLTFWEQLEFFLCLSFHVFGCWLHFSHGLEVVFVVSGTGLSSSHFGSCWCISHSWFCLILLTHSKLGAICCWCPRFLELL